MNEELKIPIKANLYNHQIKACEFACSRFGLMKTDVYSSGVALLMEMGCGKTITSIAIAGILQKYRGIKKILVAAPFSILGVWEQEFKQFSGFKFNLKVLKGSSEKKRLQIQTMHGYAVQIIVVNYESAWRLEDELLKFDADLIIADEAHKIKENRTAQSKAILPARNVPVSGSFCRKRFPMNRLYWYRKYLVTSLYR